MTVLVQDEMFDAEVRVENIIWLPGAVCSEVSPDMLDALSDGLPERSNAQIYTCLPELLKFLDFCPNADDLAEELRGASGFAVEAATPIRRHLGNGESFDSHWGMYATEWLYAASESDIGRVCIEWAEKKHADAKASFAASIKEGA